MTLMTLGVIILGSLNFIYRFGSLFYLRGKLLEKIFLWAHLLSSKMARLPSSSPIMIYVSPLQLSAKHLVSLLKLFESRRHFLRCPHTELPWSELKTFSWGCPRSFLRSETQLLDCIHLTIHPPFSGHDAVFHVMLFSKSMYFTVLVHVKLWKSNAGSILSSIAYVVVSYSLDSTYCPPPLLLSSGVFLMINCMMMWPREGSARYVIS